MIRGTLEPKSNRESFIEQIELFFNGARLNLHGVTAKVQLERTGDCFAQSDYLPYFTYGWSPSIKLLATTENGGATIINDQVIQFSFTPAQMATLPAGQYRLSANATDSNGVTQQLFQYQIPILDGGLPT